MVVPDQDVTVLARSIFATCGRGRVLHVGGDADDLALALRRLGCSAEPVAAIGALEAAATAACDVVVVTEVLDGLSSADLDDSLTMLWRTGVRHLVVRVANEPASASDETDSARDRAFWEARCFAAGYRKHARYYRVNAYEDLNQDGDLLLIPLERIADSALADYPLAELQRNRILHMDMLREVGRRGDAHCVRYHMAAQHIRPGDAVLDLACGYGYGSHLLFQNSTARSVIGVDLSQDAIDYANANYAVDGAVSYECGDAQQLATIADDSIDFIATFETIEHLPDPAAYLDELKRVLRPSGRMMVCAPNDWADETGHDPNPHHLHVYTWDRLREEIGERFLLERGYVQTAGGATKCHFAPRAWTPVPLAPLPCEAEWILLLAMKDPGQGAALAYQETRWSVPESPEFHVSAFARDYDNPWLVKGMVTIGTRLENPEELRRLRDRVLRNGPADSVDYGAALCGAAYDALAAADASQGAELVRSIQSFAAAAAPSPHQLRWQISCLFVAGELALVCGDRALAQALYEDCARRDATVYSPLLGNKTLDALYRLAVFSVQDGDLAAAREQLLRCVTEARRLATGSWLNVCGDLTQPLPFGFAELAQLLDKASRSAYALRLLQSASIRPAEFAVEARGYYERILEYKEEGLDALRQGNASLRQRIDGMEQELAAMAEQVVQKEQRIHELADEVVRQDEHAQELADEVVRQDAHAQELASEVRRQHGRAEELARAVADQREEKRSWLDRLLRRGG